MSHAAPLACLTRGPHTVFGATAEVVSVLEDAALWTEASSTLDSKLLLAALEPTRPPEERVPIAAKIIATIRQGRRLARWIPWYSRLGEHEYARAFYPAYRDHSVHTLHVFLLGVYLYETVPLLRTAMDTYLTRAVATATGEKTTTLFLEWWALAGLYHDLGYPFESDAFIPDATHRQAILTEISNLLFQNPFEGGFRSYGLDLTKAELGRAYRAGRYYPLVLETIDDVLTADDGQLPVSTMLRRLGLDAPQLNLVRELDRTTAQAAVGRPPFHDHGLFGGLLLLKLAEEAESFLTNVFDDMESGPTATCAGEGWDAFVRLGPLARLAAEAIAFHNLNFAGLDPSEARKLLGGKPIRRPGLSFEPHLFFLSLVDTLQDWDRHHFVPQTDPPRFRPSTSSRDMLLQGTPAGIRITVAGSPNALQEVQKLLGGWLDSSDVSALLKDGAEFSRPERVSAPGAASPTLASEAERRRLELVIRNCNEKARELLIRGGAGVAVEAAGQFRSVSESLKGARSTLTATDLERLESFVVEQGLATTEKMAHGLIGVGSLLTFGAVDQEVGQGGFGVVLRVVSPLGKTFAFKLFHGGELGDQEKRRLFARGFEAMRALRGHPNIVVVHEFSELPVGFYMDYIDGPDLDQGLRNIPDVHQRLQLALTVFQAVGFAHAGGILHRDIKPGNVLLAPPDWTPILTDFDLAWIGGRRTQLLTVGSYATWEYGAPELADARLARYRAEPTVDVYGAGALLWFVLSEEDPPVGAQWKPDHWSFLAKRLAGSLPAATIGALADLIRSCTQPNPAERMQTMDGVIRGLDRILAQTRVTASRMSPEDFIKEVIFRLTGTVTESPTAPSRTGGTEWRFEVTRMHSHGVTSSRLAASCTLLREPAYERVNYRQFVDRSIKGIDRKIVEYRKESGESLHIDRHGYVGGAGGSSMRLDLAHLQLTPSEAQLIGSLLSEITWILE